MIYLVCLLFIMFIVWTYNLVKGNFKVIDDKVYKSLMINNVLTVIFRFITNFASTKFFVLVSFLVLLFLKNKTLALIMIVNLILNSMLIGLIKNTFKRERPNINRLVKEHGFSYTSGHTMSAVVFYGFLIFLIVISNIILPLKILFIGLLVCFILTIGFSRIYLGVHYFSDVVGGLFIASSYLLLYIYVVYEILKLF